jgi:hypothetical protein
MDDKDVTLLLDAYCLIRHMEGESKAIPYRNSMGGNSYPVGPTVFQRLEQRLVELEVPIPSRNELWRRMDDKIIS